MRRPDPATIALGAGLLAVTAWSWGDVWRRSHAMAMGDVHALAFVTQWGVMMAAMMLPSAAPAIILYRTVRRRLAPEGERAIPASLFALIYLAVWTAAGIPVYGGYVAMSAFPVHQWLPLGVAGVLVAAGVYQFTSAKRRCLAACESPLTFFMTRWRNGYAATSALALRHALYCVGCCWALMLVLVAAGAMGIWWVGAIALVVFVEKCLPRAAVTTRLAGVALILLAVAVLLRPGLAMLLRAS